MSLWGVHVGIAVAITAPVVGYLRFSRAERWTLVCISGTLATVPDWWWLFTGRFLPRLQLPALARSFRLSLHHSALADLFWFHGVIDELGTDDVSVSVAVAACSVAVFLAVELYLSRRHTDGRTAFADGE